MDMKWLKSLKLWLVLVSAMLCGAVVVLDVVIVGFGAKVVNEYGGNRLGGWLVVVGKSLCRCIESVGNVWERSGCLPHPQAQETLAYQPVFMHPRLLPDPQCIHLHPAHLRIHYV